MSVIVTDSGFRADDWAAAIAPLGERATEPGVDIPSDTAWPEVAAMVGGGEATVGQAGDVPEMIRIAFPAFGDGRGFTLARRLRQAGYAGRLRAAGHVIADQYAMARRSGFDEVEIDDALAVRQPEPQWQSRSDWHAHDYRVRLGARPFARGD